MRRSALLLVVHSAVLTGGLLLACHATVPEPPVAESAESEVAEVVAAFRTNCTGCHVVPDPRFAADQAWLARLEVTG